MERRSSCGFVLLAKRCQFDGPLCSAHGLMNWHRLLYYTIDGERESCSIPHYYSVQDLIILFFAAVGSSSSSSNYAVD